MCVCEAIDGEGRLTEPLGLKMAELPVDPMVARMLLKSAEFGCSQEVATIVAMMQVQNVFYYPTRGQEAIKGLNKYYFVFFAIFIDFGGGFLTILNVCPILVDFLKGFREIFYDFH